MRLTRYVLLAAFVFFSILSVGAGTAAVQAPGRTPVCTETMQSSIGRCPATGCGARGDALLNQMKNRTDAVSSPERLTLAQIRRLNEPDSFSAGSPRTDFAANEARGVMITGFLLKALRQGGESCNCGITGPTNTDVHMVLVDKLPDMDDKDEINQAEENSVTAEITPRIRRRGHPNWVVSQVNNFEGEFVRITGWLLLDTEHISRTLRRATNWEVHPVTRFEVCKSTEAECRRGRGWQPF